MVKDLGVSRGASGRTMAGQQEKEEGQSKEADMQAHMCLL